MTTRQFGLPHAGSLNVISYVPLVKRITDHILPRVPPWIGREDLEQEGAKILSGLSQDGIITAKIRNLDAWLWRCIENRLWSYVRSECSESHAELVFDRPSEEAPHDQRIVEAEQFTRARRALRRLPPEVRATVKLKMRGYSNRTIGEKQGITGRAVGQRVAGAIKRMRLDLAA